MDTGLGLCWGAMLVGIRRAGMVGWYVVVRRSEVRKTASGLAERTSHVVTWPSWHATANFLPSADHAVENEASEPANKRVRIVFRWTCRAITHRCKWRFRWKWHHHHHWHYKERPYYCHQLLIVSCHREQQKLFTKEQCVSWNFEFLEYDLLWLTGVGKRMIPEAFNLLSGVVRFVATVNTLTLLSLLLTNKRGSAAAEGEIDSAGVSVLEVTRRWLLIEAPWRREIYDHGGWSSDCVPWWLSRDDTNSSAFWPPATIMPQLSVKPNSVNVQQESNHALPSSNAVGFKV